MKDGVKLLQIGNSCLTIKTKKEMKKNLFMVAAVALMALVSCSKEDFNNGVQGGASDIVFSAELEQPAGLPAAEPAEIQSKTSLGTAVNGVRPVSWVKDDQIKINGVTFKAASAGSRTDFTPTGSFNTAATYYAVYPASATGASDLSKVVIPSSQTGTFAEAAISVAQSNTQSLSFKNVASIVKFQVYADFTGNIKISSNQNLAGVVSVSFAEDGTPVIDGEVSNPSKEVIVKGTFTKGNDYYVAVLPGDHNFSIYYEGFLSKSAKNAVKTTRAVMSNLRTFPEPNLLYLVPNNNWKDGNARFAAYFFNSDTDTKWVDMNAYNGMYACEKPLYSTAIFCRMNPGNKTNNWNTKWNQTDNMTIGTEKYCVIPFDVWDGLTVWSETNQYDKSNRIYLVPSGNWQEANARFEAYFFGNGDQWVTMKKISWNPTYYEAQYKSGMTKVIFLRKDPSSKEHDFNSGVWAKTGDLTFGANNFWGNSGWNTTGTWSKK